MEGISHVQLHSCHKWTNKSKEEEHLSTGMAVQRHGVRVVNGPVMTSQVPRLSEYTISAM